MVQKPHRAVAGRRGFLTAVAGAGAFALAGCAGPAAGTTIETVLTDFAIDLSETEVPAGTITFDITNEGELVHEVIVVATDIAPDQLPTENRQVVEDDLDVVDEVEDIQSGDSATLEVELQSGPHVVFCNIDDHYLQGMFVGLTVT